MATFNSQPLTKRVSYSIAEAHVQVELKEDTLVQDARNSIARLLHEKLSVDSNGRVVDPTT
ncbi:hypothetical protein MD484_g4322, partial [Candolleomyces efflorescens]